MYSREQLFQDNLEQLRKKANGKEVLNLRETAEILGFRDARTVKKRYPFVDGYISLATLARCLTPEYPLENGTDVNNG